MLINWFSIFLEKCMHIYHTENYSIRFIIKGKQLENVVKLKQIFGERLSAITA